MFIDFLAQLFSLKLGMLLQPPICFHNLIGISGGCEDLRHQGIRVQCDRRDQLLQLFRSLLCSLNRGLRGRLIRLIRDGSRHSG